MSKAAFAGSVLALAGVAVAQSTWHLSGSEAVVRIVGPAVAQMQGPQPEPVSLPAGDYAVHFGTDSDGKPMSLSFAVDDAAVVHLAIAKARAAAGKLLSLDAAEWRETVGGALPANWQARCTGSPDATDYRIAATFASQGADCSVGVVARWLDAQQHYRFVWDRPRAELRLERQLGDQGMLLGQAPAPANDDHDHTMALQVEGFRIAAFCDDAVIVQAFDGAFTAGAFGTWSSGDGVTWRRLAIEPPAMPRASCAIVRTVGSATFHAATTVVPGSYHVLELALDRPYPILPFTASGLEPWLLLGPAAPQVLLADWRGSLGQGGLSEVPRQGVFASSLQWPEMPGLRGQAVVVRALFVTADGGAVVGRTPAVPLLF